MALSSLLPKLLMERASEPAKCSTKSLSLHFFELGVSENPELISIPSSENDKNNNEMAHLIDSKECKLELRCHAHAPLGV